MELFLAIIVAVATVGVAFWAWRKDTFTFLDQSFKDLQSINEKILESSENIDAAIYSICPEDKITTDEARQIYIQYLRINRLFRAWQYQQRKFITKRESMVIIDNHASVLKKHEDILEKMMVRGGYPPKFRKFLIKVVDRSEALEPFRK